MKLVMLGILGGLLGACVIGGNSAKPAPNPQAVEAAYRVTVGKNDAPPGAVELGSIEAVHGEGCGSWGSRGTFEGAMFELRNLAAMRQANYVMLVSSAEPHSEPGCFNNLFVIRGFAYRIPTAGPDPSPVPAPAALQPSSSPAGSSACYPPCSPGYRCEGQTCVAQCNPACGAGQLCRQDRTCALAPAATPAPASAPPAVPAPTTTTTPR